jgi:hypothetical protein
MKWRQIKQYSEQLLYGTYQENGNIFLDTRPNPAKRPGTSMEGIFLQMKEAYYQSWEISDVEEMYLMTPMN